ncbi:hypothetical protein [Methylobacterium haplocladii]|uniref:Uncharacterized protein n=1 Tax=Methylobacterium haplocladii TaxID=1176176 RepID=A0A512IT19_9HYPH|nr:hypothetical protein [Methylobacterium haplocladii]GEP00858.1 hypothetical protein MHA02_32450 [Methylobacterium haplocladii]GJD86162.1 hypothetical protein HPGCJGGD_4059 [Methylobacterium haplocladii]GLS60206.1 hypothetical protein GCM10007887_28840 [Methylobacterium haplocladii]
MPLHSRRLLNKAAVAIEGRISIKQNPDRDWPRDHARLRVLERNGNLRWVGTQAGPHLGGTFAVWQITDEGRTRVAAWEPPAIELG